MPSPRWMLQTQAMTWRGLMDIGMYLHTLAPPQPPAPSFWKEAPVTISTTPGTIWLAVYTPENYDPKRAKRYAVLVNFHGGGFTLGRATDDCRWCGAVTTQCDAIVVSVAYRLAPEHPFPTAIEDGADAVLWLVDHADELGIDVGRIAISGFSAGGNMAFTVPMRVEEELRKRKGIDELVESRAVKHSETLQRRKALEDSVIVTDAKKRGAISAIVAFYPSTDFTNTREQRRATITRKDKDLPTFFTKLFDASYLYPPLEIMTDNIYLSPGVASDEILRHDLPGDIVMFTCEWDELRAEGERFKERLGSEGLGKRLRYKMVEGVQHGWDKAPNPYQRDEKAEACYKEACDVLNSVWKEGYLLETME